VARPLTIDTHAHYFPESYLKLIADHGKRCGTTVVTDPSGARFIQVGLLLRTGPITSEFYDLDDRLKTMNRIGVGMHALSPRAAWPRSVAPRRRPWSATDCALTSCLPPRRPRG